MIGSSIAARIGENLSSNEEDDAVNVKETLEKQLQLLSERSEKAHDTEIVELTEAMVAVANLLLALDGNQSFYEASTSHPYVVQLPAEDLVDLYAARAERLSRHSLSHKK